MGISFSEVPSMFGPLHLCILAAVFLTAAVLWFPLKRASDRTLRRVLFALGAVMLLTEAWKQWFVPRYVYPDTPSMWFFPWQLCSMAMYCSVLVPFLKGKAREAALVFLSSFSLLGALVALVIPGDMLRPQVWLFVHGFVYHGLMLIESAAAMLLLAREKRPHFRPALLLYLGMAAVAEIINVISHAVIADIHFEANMFYITPYYPSTQPVFHEIALALGIPVEIAVYLGAIALASFGLFALENALLRKKSR